jgi:putative oxidoreductase
MKRSLLSELLVASLVLLFVYAATSKFLDFPSFRSVLSTSPLIGKYAPVVAWVIPTFEYLACGLLFFQSTRAWGLRIFLIMMLAFTAYIGYLLAYSPQLPCSCGGVIKQLTWKQHFVFNIFFTTVALVGIWLSRKPPDPVQGRESFTWSKWPGFNS